jgi:hypothetical protein
MFQIKFVKKIKAHILCTVTFFSGNGAVYEIMTKNLVESKRDHRQYGACAWHAG